MSTATLERPRLDDTAARDDIDHIYCCDPDLSLCGIDISAEPEVPARGRDCRLCVLAEVRPCPRCGQ